MILFFESVAAEKTAIFAENSRFFFFFFFYFFCVGIPILKIVLSHAHEWVTFDVILQKWIFL